MHVPFTGLGLWNGFRGDRWLRNRIKIFKQFVIPSLQAQTNQEFIVWVAWRYEEKTNKQVIALERYLKEIFGEDRVVFTFSGIAFWDDKHPDDVAELRLVNAIHGAMGDLLNIIGEAETVLMTIQPSDDCYYKEMVEETQNMFENTDYQVIGYKNGYVADYVNGRISQWNPETTPPFYTIKFPRETFIDPIKHLKYTGPYHSHEYVKDFLKAIYLSEPRGYMVGTHGENISTIFNHPFTGHEFLGTNLTGILKTFGLERVEHLKLNTSLRKKFMRKLPHNWQKKLRYLLGERFFARLYKWIRS